MTATSAPTQYTVFSNGYTTAQELFTQSKEYKGLSLVSNLAERVGASVLTNTSRLTGVENYEQVDKIVRPRLDQADVITSPYVAKTYEAVDFAGAKVKPLVAKVKALPGVETASARVGIAQGIAAKNLEEVRKRMLIENPETVVEVEAVTE